MGGRDSLDTAPVRLRPLRFVWLTEEEEAIYAAHFNDDEDAGKNMTKPLFKKLMSIARRAECDADFTVLERGKTSGLALLVDGTATISSSTWSTSMLGNTEEAMQYRLRSFPTTAHAPVEIVRGRGFYGEVSFVHGLTSGRNDAARADVSFSAGSRYIFWDGEELRALLKKNPALSNALIACVSMTISRKLYDTTTSVDSTSRDLQNARTELNEEVYRRDAISVALHALVEQKDCEEPGSGAKLFAYLEDLRAKRASRLGPLAAAGTATCDHDARAHRRHAISGETHERMLKELRLKLSDDERILGPDAPSLIDLCSRLVERVRPEAKIDRRVNLLKGGGSRHPSFVVRQGSVHYGDGPG